MKSLIPVPREALEQLLQAAGSALTPEQFVASIPETGEFKKYPGRAWAAAFNKYFILIVAVLSVVLLPFLGFTIENVVIVVGLCVVTYFEYRVHRYFSENDRRAPGLGFRNQAGFAAAILIYCLYHALVVSPLSPEDANMIEVNNLIDPSVLKGLSRIFYLVAGVIAGGSQFALACYYRSAENKPVA